MYHDLERTLTLLSLLGFFGPLLLIYRLKWTPGTRSFVLKGLLGILTLLSALLFCWLSSINGLRFH